MDPTQPSYYTLTKEPTGETYHKLLDYAVDRCGIALLVVRPSLSLSHEGNQVLEKLAPFLKEGSESPEWPGTRLLGGTAMVFRYHFGVECAEILKGAANALYSWRQPDLPE